MCQVLRAQRTFSITKTVETVEIIPESIETETFRLESSDTSQYGQWSTGT